MKKQNYLDFVHGILSSEEDFLLFKVFYQQRLPKSFKVISSRISRESLSSFLKIQWWKIYSPDFLLNSKYNDVEYVDCIDSKTLWTHCFHTAWLFYIQEVSAWLSAQVLNLESWDLVLDLCAAPWGKTVQLADKLLCLWNWHVFANEPSFARRKALVFNLNRCWLYNTSILWYDGTSVGELAPEMFDKVLVDAPCSWEGMQYKYDKNVVYWDSNAAEKLSKLQKQLLVSWLKALKSWWELVYSTCTLNPYENEWVISYVLDMFPWEIELLNVDIDGKSIWLKDFLWNDECSKVARFWPHVQKTWWFFIAKFKKLKGISTDKKIDKRVLKKSEYDDSDILQKNVRNYLDKEWWVNRDNKFHFFSSKEYVFVKDNYKINNNWLFVEKSWIPIIKLWFKWDYIPQQWLAAVFWNIMNKNIINLTYEQIQKISEWSDILWSYWSDWCFFVVKLNSVWLFLVKQVWNILKMKI